MELKVNGESQTLSSPMRLSEFLEKHELKERLVVVELNREIIPRPRYSETVLREGDEIEIVQMMAGG